MISSIALLGVVAIATYLIVFALLTVFKPDSAANFMRLFATSAKAHFTELFFRVGAGVALIFAAPRLANGSVFEIFGWTLIATSFVLAILPWRLHSSFARKVIPTVLKHLKLYGACSALLGLYVVASVIIGSNG